MWGWAKIPPDGDTKDARAVETLPRVVTWNGAPSVMQLEYAPLPELAALRAAPLDLFPNGGGSATATGGGDVVVALGAAQSEIQARARASARDEGVAFALARGNSESACGLRCASTPPLLFVAFHPAERQRGRS